MDYHEGAAVKGFVLVKRSFGKSGKSYDEYSRNVKIPMRWFSLFT
jgi:hypothetical protein